MRHHAADVGNAFDVGIDNADVLDRPLIVCKQTLRIAGGIDIQATHALAVAVKAARIQVASHRAPRSDIR